MTSTNVTFPSDGWQLRGVLERPAGDGSRRAAVILLHGFGANKDDGMITTTAAVLARFGYATLRFDMRGCGESEGPRARVLCEEQVRDVRNAVSFLQQQEGIAADRIAVLGHSFGAAVAVYAAGVDQRIAACVSSAGWGDGEVKLRQQHAGEQAWKKFEEMLARGRTMRAEGRELHVGRFDVVPIPQHMRGGLPPGAFMEFPFDVVESMLAFRPLDVVAAIAPRPLLLLHPSRDAVTPTEQSIELFRHAAMPVDLHLFAGIDHFIFSDDNQLVLDLLGGWLARNLPSVQAEAVTA